MKDYVKMELAKIKNGMPKDDQRSAMHAIYAFLEANGYTIKQAKVLIDEVIYENIKYLMQKLNISLEKLQEVKDNSFKLNFMEDDWKFYMSN